jgi:hypothetical protein
MTTQPEALRLADELRAAPERSRTSFEAAAELRRLHAENERLAAEVANRNRRALDGDEAVSALANVHAYYEGLEAQRDALLEALKSTGLFLHHCWCDVQMNDYSFEKLNRQMEIVDAALMAAEETK